MLTILLSRSPTTNITENLRWLTRYYSATCKSMVQQFTGLIPRIWLKGDPTLSMMVTVSHGLKSYILHTIFNVTKSGYILMALIDN